MYSKLETIFTGSTTIGKPSAPVEFFFLWIRTLSLLALGDTITISRRTFVTLVPTHFQWRQLATLFTPNDLDIGAVMVELFNITGEPGERKQTLARVGA